MPPPPLSPLRPPAPTPTHEYWNSRFSRGSLWIWGRGGVDPLDPEIPVEKRRTRQIAGPTNSNRTGAICELDWLIRIQLVDPSLEFSVDPTHPIRFVSFYFLLYCDFSAEYFVFGHVFHVSYHTHLIPASLYTNSLSNYFHFHRHLIISNT